MEAALRWNFWSREQLRPVRWSLGDTSGLTWLGGATGWSLCKMKCSCSVSLRLSVTWIPPPGLNTQTDSHNVVMHSGLTSEPLKPGQQSPALMETNHCCHFRFTQCSDKTVFSK